MARTEGLKNATNYKTEVGIDIKLPGDRRMSIDTVFATTGKVGNFNVSVNKGIELDWDLGKIKPLQTSVYLTGAYMESPIPRPTPCPSRSSILRR